MRSFWLALAVYPAFFALLGFACYVSGSAYPLFGLLLMPSLREDGTSTKPMALRWWDNDSGDGDGSSPDR